MSGRVGLAPWSPSLLGLQLVNGLGSGLSEEPAVQDVEPITLDYESFLNVLPGPPWCQARTGPFGIIDKVPVDHIGDPPRQRRSASLLVLPSATLRSK